MMGIDFRRAYNDRTMGNGFKVEEVRHEEDFFLQLE